ncbi:TIGR03986 family CRISPR-associated RAMP protein [Wenzhouxiangella sp. XN79A]|uniref:TIGR03986 family type III CRISPR-associated RAMP protein n=1 Tax=Wenzhouxiangella sp. XN79A TaxID=2724193 RepID=UPI00144A6A40|nr:TIGR03986 family CRISPR-associated RAMP protein [Wenzhouxiangella sp. XN79A]NKI33905.1 TIGR03986 family CRISPR-associated RAMP protein [Wenzhouxiangella sp. XN79A]
MSTIKVLSSPYNFVPLHEEVYVPEWWKEASHDVPFEDGLNAEIHYTLRARSPLLVGGPRTPLNGKQPQQVHPFQLGNGQQSYAIPGSSLKGMLRAVLEIAAFGRMRFVDDRALSVRDLTNKARSFYGELMSAQIGHKKYKPRVRSGWLELDETGAARITPCQYARVDHDDLASFSGDEIWREFPRKPDSRFKYEKWAESGCELELWFQPEAEEEHAHSGGKTLVYRKARSLGDGPIWGTLVFTGQPAKRERGKPGKKHMEFVFYEDPAEPLESFPVEEHVWREFLQVHDSSPEWEYWRRERYVPVFYLGSESAADSFGLAQMYRLPYEFSIGETIDHSNSDHRLPPGTEHEYDLADLLFGAAGDGELDSLRGRVSVETAVLVGDASTQLQSPTVLSSPKPGFYPAYVQQNSHDNSRLNGGTYQTYKTLKGSRAPRIRGFKRYPARPGSMVRVQDPPEKSKPDVQVVLEPLAEGVQFSGRILCHNLKPEELGALLWVMTWGGRKELNHSLGMGKPFGFGQVALNIDHSASKLWPNDPDKEEQTLDEPRFEELITLFESLMEKNRPRSNSTTTDVSHWEQTPQLTNLLAMACPGAATEYQETTGARLEYMGTPKAYQDVKGGKNQAALVLPNYAEATPEALANLSKIETGYGHPWIDEMVPTLSKSNNAPEEAVLRGRVLAQAWAELDEGAEKQEIHQAIKNYWNRAGVFDMPGGAVKKAKAIYGW